MFSKTRGILINEYFQPSCLILCFLNKNECVLVFFNKTILKLNKENKGKNQKGGKLYLIL